MKEKRRDKLFYPKRFLGDLLSPIQCPFKPKYVILKEEGKIKGLAKLVKDPDARMQTIIISDGELYGERDPRFRKK